MHMHYLYVWSTMHVNIYIISLHFTAHRYSIVSDSWLWFLVPTTSVLCAPVTCLRFVVRRAIEKITWLMWMLCVHTRYRDERYRKNIFSEIIPAIRAYLILHSKLFCVALEDVWFSGVPVDSKNSHIFNGCHMFKLVSRNGHRARF
jgi:uncharacterized membrane protein